MALFNAFHHKLLASGFLQFQSDGKKCILFIRPYWPQYGKPEKNPILPGIEKAYFLFVDGKSMRRLMEP